MNWLDRLERRFGRYAIPGLIRHIALGMIVVFGLQHLQLVHPLQLALHGDSILQGQVWRLVTFLFLPMADGVFFLLIQLMFMVMTGDGLEAAWGSFRLTVYYLVGAFATVAIALLMPGAILSNDYLNLSLFFAFATIYPDYEILLFFVLPVKVKWLALLSAAWVVWTLLTAPLFAKLIAALSVANYLLFFGAAAIGSLRQSAANRERREKMEEAYRRVATMARNTCTICGRTEVSHPEPQTRPCPTPPTRVRAFRPETPAHLTAQTGR